MPAATQRSAARRPSARAESGPIGKNLGLDPGDIVDRLVGVITKIYPPETKPGQYGDYTIQNCEMELEYLNQDRIDEAPTVRISIFDGELESDYLHASITMSSVKLKGAKQGVSYECNHKGTKCYENFKVAGKNAIWDFTVPQTDSPPRQPKPEPERHSEYRENSAPAPKESRVEYDEPAKDRSAARVSADDIVKAVGDVHNMVVVYMLEKHPKIADITLQSFINTAFIESAKQGAVQRLIVERTPLRTSGLDPHPPRQQKPEPETEPVDHSDWRNILIPVGSEEIKGRKLGEIDNFLRYELWKFLSNKAATTQKPHTPFALFVMAAGEELEYSTRPPSKPLPPPEDDDIPF